MQIAIVHGDIDAYKRVEILFLSVFPSRSVLPDWKTDTTVIRKLRTRARRPPLVPLIIAIATHSGFRVN